MTILQSLDQYYVRMAKRGEAELPGFSREKISYVIVLSSDGSVAAVRDLREQKGKKLLARLISVPAGSKRSSGIAPNLFWDKTAYVLGRTAGDGKRTAQEHDRFKVDHLALMGNATDDGLVAFRAFLQQWTPERFDAPLFDPEMLDTNMVFELEGDHLFLHEREAVQVLLSARVKSEGNEAFCLVSGQRAQVQRLHPTIKGVDGAQSSGASLVSFNLDAFSSYGNAQGDNAPVSEITAFRYGEALNRLLDRDRSRTRIKIGDTTVVFWADASAGEGVASATEDFFGNINEPPDDAQEAAKMRDALEHLRKGAPVSALNLGLVDGTRFHVLGLSPNAARLSVRFWLVDDFSFFARALADHYHDLSIEPAPWGAKLPSVQRLLVRTTALLEKFDNIPHALAGETLRAILAGGRYPHTLLSAAIIRLRAGDDANHGWHAAVIKAVLARDLRLKFSMEELPVSLDRDNPHPAYQLGRLFAAFETAQRIALGNVNATIRDRYFGAASATPASVFPLLMRGVQSHLGKLRKSGKGAWLEREIEDISDRLPPALPRSLGLEAQGRFVLGYYHQRKGRFADQQAAKDLQEIETQETTDDKN